ncbi:hypothetical protein BCR43DRAFT_488435 [Syncephalastrum racemosum]|uniref:F-box domain-containing protein n=1 Tax=Syncephalastrum racemosum TaxID=13706 RepID=A0A1X2HIL1_SYNRA|nr:hypothetical protein BCR43DRAFT_488435 [Syncephalastrum racemosum]
MGNDRVLSNFVCMHSQQLSLLTYVHIIAEDTFDVGLMLRLFTDCPNLEVLSCNRMMQEVNGLPSPPLPAAALARLVALQVPFLGVPFWQRVLPNLRALKVLTISCPQRYTGRVDKEGLIAPALVSVLGEAHIQQELRHLELSNGMSENELVHLANLYANSQPGLRNCVVDSRIELDEPIRRIISSIVVSHVHTLQSLNCPVIVAEGIRSLLEGNHIFRSLTVMEVKGHAPFPIGRGNDDRRNFAPWVSTLLQRTPSLVHLALSFISGLDFATYAALIQLVQLRSVKLLLCDDFIPYFVQFIQVAAGNGVPALQDIDVQSVCIHLAIILCRFSVQAAISPVSEDFDFTKELDAGRKEEVLYCLRKPNVNSHSTPSPMELLIEFNICKWADCFLFLASSVF